MLVRCTVYGKPRTKKNHGEIVMRGRYPKLLPSHPWRLWCATCRIESVGDVPIGEPVNMAANFYRDANRGDLMGYIDGLADLLEKHGILENDKWIKSLDGCRLHVDKKNPRVDVEFEVFK